MVVEKTARVIADVADLSRGKVGASRSGGSCGTTGNSSR